MKINKDTKLYGSFSLKAGNNGNIYFNNLFQEHNIDALYKSYSITNIEDAVKAAKCLNFSGFAVSMPFKRDILKYVDKVTVAAAETNSANTIVNDNGQLIAHNTDYIGVRETIKDLDSIIILGDGGMASSAIYAAQLSGIEFEQITRDNWYLIKTLRYENILNCTPVENIEMDESNNFIDAIPTTFDGKNIHKILAKEQFYLYTGIKI